jgi:hypothetical protein
MAATCLIGPLHREAEIHSGYRPRQRHNAARSSATTTAIEFHEHPTADAGAAVSLQAICSNRQHHNITASQHHNIMANMLCLSAPLPSSTRCV